MSVPENASKDFMRSCDSFGSPKLSAASYIIREVSVRQEQFERSPPRVNLIAPLRIAFLLLLASLFLFFADIK